MMKHISEPRLLDVLPQLDGIIYKERLFSSKLVFTTETAGAGVQKENLSSMESMALMFMIVLSKRCG